MFQPARHQFHEWTLADFTSDDRELSLEERISSIADHQCTTSFAKQIVRAFGCMKLDFYLQRDPAARALLERFRSFNATRMPDPYGPDQPEGPCTASIAWRIEQAWSLLEQGESRPQDEALALAKATAAMIAPLENIEGSVRHQALGAFPFVWIPHYSKRDHAFRRFNGRQLNANSLQYKGPDAAVDALFRFATLSTEDLYIACAALLMDHGANVAPMDGLCVEARGKTARGPWGFVYTTLPTLVDDHTCSPEEPRRTVERASAVRTYLVQPLAALYACGAMRRRGSAMGQLSALERRLRNASQNRAA